TALSQGISPYSSWSGPPELVIDDPRCSTNGQPWDVHNYADESAGTMNLLDAIAHSVNTIYAQLSDTVGPANVVATARKLGITSPLLPVCSITLGTQGVSPLEMTDAYAALAARGSTTTRSRSCASGSPPARRSSRSRRRGRGCCGR